MKPQTNATDTSTAISNILAQLHGLLRKEIALLKSEMAARMNHAVVAVAMIGLALVLTMIGLNILAVASAAALVSAGFTPASATAAIAATCLILALGIGWKAVAMLKSASLVPHNTIKTIQKDAAILKETYDD